MILKHEEVINLRVWKMSKFVKIFLYFCALCTKHRKFILIFLKKMKCNIKCIFHIFSPFSFIYMTFCLVLWLGVRGRSWNRYFLLDVVHSFSYFFFLYKHNRVLYNVHAFLSTAIIDYIFLAQTKKKTIYKERLHRPSCYYIVGYMIYFLFQHM